MMNIIKFKNLLNFNHLRKHNIKQFSKVKSYDPQILVINKNENENKNNTNKEHYKFENLFDKQETAINDKYSNLNISNNNSNIKIFGKTNITTIFNKNNLTNNLENNLSNTEKVIENKYNSNSYFSDKCRIYIKAGDGGNGKFLFDKGPMLDQSRPDGGSGGRGGNIFLKGDKGLNSLAYIRKGHFEASNGLNGQSRGKDGKEGKDLEISVPLGTTVYEILRDKKIVKKELRNNEPYTKKFLYDIIKDGERFLIVKGGKGGLGNYKGKHNSKKNKVLSQEDLTNNRYGGKGQEMEIELELKCVADICLLGFPNAGKSTLLASLTRSMPKIASYAFTTLNPHLGIIKYKDFKEIIIEDLPGIIEGAHENKGLGHKFLKHLDRVKSIIIILDGTNSYEYNKRNPVIDLTILIKEVVLYKYKLLKKPFLIILNKNDTENYELYKKNKELLLKEIKLFSLDILVNSINTSNRNVKSNIKIVHNNSNKLENKDKSNKVKNVEDINYLKFNNKDEFNKIEQNIKNSKIIEISGKVGTNLNVLVEEIRNIVDK